MKSSLNAKKAEIMLLCGALHDIAELSRQESISRHIKVVQEKLEKIVTQSMNKNTSL